MEAKETGNRQAGAAGVKITVVTVALNSQDVIERTIRSILGQTVAPYEYLVIDGLSADRTVEIAQSYAPQFAQRGIRFAVTSEKDSGAYNAMNKGIRAATGDFVSILNAGDWYEPDAIEKVCAFYEEEPFDLTFGGLHYVFLDGKVVNKMSRLDRFPINTRHWNHPTMFLRRELYQKYGLDESLPICADFNLYLKLRKAGIRIRVMDDILGNFMADGISTDPSGKRCWQRANEKYRAYRENGYSRIYWLECYGWEVIRMLYLRLHRRMRAPDAAQA